VIVLFFGHYSDSQCKFVGNNVNNIRKFKQESTSIKSDYKHEKRILKWVSSPAYNICILQIWILYTFIILHWSDRLFWTLLWLTTLICLQTTENTYKRQLKNFNINDKQLRWTEFVCCFLYIFLLFFFNLPWVWTCVSVLLIVIDVPSVNAASTAAIRLIRQFRHVECWMLSDGSNNTGQNNNNKKAHK